MLLVRGSSDARLLRSFVTIDCKAADAGDDVLSPSNSLGGSAFVGIACVGIERGGKGGGTGRLGKDGGSDGAMALEEVSAAGVVSSSSPVDPF